MKLVKRLISLLLVVIMLIGIHPMSIFAISEEKLKDIVNNELLIPGKIRSNNETNTIRVFFEDAMASTSVTYTTIGWTIRGTGEHSGKSVRIQNVQLGDIKNYPTDGTVTTVFEMSWDYIESRMIDEGYEDWSIDLATKGGIVEFNSIFTIKEGGILQGSINKDGEMTGETYTTYSGIANARGWDSSTLNSLRSRFDIPLEFYQIDNLVTVMFKEYESGIDLASNDNYILEDGLTVDAKAFDGYFFTQKTVNGEVFSEDSHIFGSDYEAIDYEIVFYYTQEEVEPDEPEIEEGDGDGLVGEDLDPEIKGAIKSYDVDDDDDDT